MYNIHKEFISLLELLGPKISILNKTEREKKKKKLPLLDSRP